MGLGVHFTEDLAALLRGLSSAGQAYGIAYQKAICDMALMLGIAPAEVFPSSQARFILNYKPLELLEAE